MLKSFLVTILLISSSAFSQEQIVIGGGSGPIHNVFERVKEPFKKHSNIELKLIADGPDRALADLDAGKIEVASAGVTVEQWFKLMEEKKLPLKHKEHFKFKVIGRDIIRVVTHKDLQVGNLNPEQIEKIFTGKAKSWKEVGGPDVPITVVIGQKIPGIYKFWSEKTMGAQPYGGNKVDAGDTLDVEKTVAKTPGAIGLGPMGAPGEGVFYPVVPEIGRPIIAATKGIPSARVRKLFDFIEKEGKKYISAK